MDKEEILKMSREENEGRQDEYETAAASTAAKAGMLAGGLVCVALAFIGKFILKLPAISFAGWMVYFAMYAASNFVLFRKLGNRRNLFWGIVTAAASVGFCIALIVTKNGMQ